MAPCSTPGEAQTFQISRRQLFSHLRRRASAGKAPDPEGRTRQRRAATGRRQRWSSNRGSRPHAKMTRAIQQNARSGSVGTVSQPTRAWRQIGGSARVLPEPPVSLSVTAARSTGAPGSRIRPGPLDDPRLASILRLWAAQGLQALGQQRPSRSTALKSRRHPGFPSGRGSYSPLAPGPATGFTAMGDGSCSMQTEGDARAMAVPEDPVGGMCAHSPFRSAGINMQARPPQVELIRPPGRRHAKVFL